MSVRRTLTRVVTAVAVAVGASAASATLLDFSITIPNEMAPAGALVQMKVRTTEVTPISGGRPSFLMAPMFASVEGFGLFAPGEGAGAAIIDGSQVSVSSVSSSPVTGDYPILTVVTRIRPDVAVGTRTRFTIDPRSSWFYTGLGWISPTSISPGTVQVGGTLAIHDVIPGEGVWPAGTVVSVRGVGFTADTRLRVGELSNIRARFVSANEMQFTLPAATEIRGLRIKASGSSNSTTYYAYMRGITAAVSRRALLSITEPIFGVAQRQVATLGPFGSLRSNQYVAIGLQNPNRSDVRVTLSLLNKNGTLAHRSSLTLATRRRVALTAAELLDGVVPPAGSTIVVTASAPIDAISLLCDEGAWSVAPSLPREALR